MDFESYLFEMGQIVPTGRHDNDTYIFLLTHVQAILFHASIFLTDVTKNKHIPYLAPVTPALRSQPSFELVRRDTVTYTLG